MVTETILTMDPITHCIDDMKQDSCLDDFSDMHGVNKRRVAKSRQVERPNTTMHLLPQQNGWNLSMIKEGVKRAKPEAPKFLLLLYEILEVESSRVIRWSEDGLALQILDPVTVTEQILPKYFNHTNFHSFQRQLNYFGFRKWTKSKTDICTFSHPFFRENQPKLLLLIKRKKAPRRTPASGTSSSTLTTPTAAVASLTPKKSSPCGKQRLSSDDSNSEGISTQSTRMHIQMINMPAGQIQPTTNGMLLSAMTTPHGTSSHGSLGFSQDGLNRQYVLEPNNVISPVAATECKKKAKKLDKKDYLASTTIDAPLAPPLEESNSLMNTSAMPSIGAAKFMSSSSSMAADSSNASLCNSSRSDVQYTSISPLTSVALPTLDIVRSRLIRRQQAGGPEQQQHSVLQQQYKYRELSGFSAPNGPQGMVVTTMENRSELSARPIPMTPVSRSEMIPDQNPAFSNSFSDPVNILLRIKKSRSVSGEGKDVGTKHEQVDDQNESLASLHNYLLGNSLFTNRLQAQLKFIADENEALRHLLDTKQHEVNKLQGERKVLQHENAVLLEDKNKLFEMNRDLLSKLFPQ
ncbi:unnamed protein product [Peronospora belbahrii]|uniref:HSF-type DNA-binding domain-containing protein n=2 Tax=Peronospora belbahrii TaxID=622444 RepID=A0AAU9KXR9_9STRA|nr:unnamed protein product [Peronospora belbahrii]CAH0520159.1 unnamed protein product [Peronospora belbahrii]